MLADTVLFVKRAARSGWYILLEFRSLSVGLACDLGETD